MRQFANYINERLKVDSNTKTDVTFEDFVGHQFWKTNDRLYAANLIDIDNSITKCITVNDNHKVNPPLVRKALLSYFRPTDKDEPQNGVSVRLQIEQAAFMTVDIKNEEMFMTFFSQELLSKLVQCLDVLCEVNEALRIDKALERGIDVDFELLWDVLNKNGFTNQNLFSLHVVLGNDLPVIPQEIGLHAFKPYAGQQLCYIKAGNGIGTKLINVYIERRGHPYGFSVQRDNVLHTLFSNEELAKIYNYLEEL
jgi:hypothetical protein